MTHGMLVNACVVYFQTLAKGKNYVFKSSTGHVKTEDGRHFKTGKKGNADITMCYEGRYVGIECKIGKDVQSASQKKAQADIEAAGGEYFIVRTLADVKKLFP